MTISTYTVTISNAPSNDGFITNVNYRTYIIAGGVSNADLANSLSNAKGMMRMKAITIGLIKSGLRMGSITMTGGSVNTQPTAISFTCTGTSTTADELNPGATLTGIPSVERVVARALSTDETGVVSYVNPTTPLTFITASVTAEMIISGLVPAAALVTVTETTA